MRAALVAAAAALLYRPMCKLFFLLGWLTLVLPARAQNKVQDEKVVPPAPSSGLNKLDNRGKKNGTWFTTTEPRMGEPGVSEFGSYDHGFRYGFWYKIDHAGDLVSIEHFKNGVLDGEVKYYDRGRLYCIGHYRGLNPLYQFDTIVVMDPITHDEKLRVIPTEYGSLRHGMWVYYDPESGATLKEEEYQVDDLIYRKEYNISAAADSLMRLRNQARLPHLKAKQDHTPAARRQSLTGY